MKRILPLLLILSLLLTACGGAQKTPADTPSDRNEDTTELLNPPSAEELQDEYFRVIGGLEVGTAGASLKRAQAIQKVLRFASNHQLSKVDVTALRNNLMEAWNGLTEEERSSFDGNFIDICRIMDDCSENWESNRGAFDDAGVGDQMEVLLKDSYEDWSILKAHTLTMGNSDGA